MLTDRFHVDTKSLLKVVRALFNMFSSNRLSNTFNMVPTWYFASSFCYVVFIKSSAYKTAWNVTTPKTLKYVCMHYAQGGAIFETLPFSATNPGYY